MPAKHRKPTHFITKDKDFWKIRVLEITKILSIAVFRLFIANKVKGQCVCNCAKTLLLKAPWLLYIITLSEMYNTYLNTYQP